MDDSSVADADVRVDLASVRAEMLNAIHAFRVELHSSIQVAQDENRANQAEFRAECAQFAREFAFERMRRARRGRCGQCAIGDAAVDRALSVGTCALSPPLRQLCVFTTWQVLNCTL